MGTHEFTCDASMNRQRLDAALEKIFPELGLRARRRLWDWCAISVDGKSAKPGYELKTGQLVKVECHEPAGLNEQSAAGACGLELVAATGDYCAVYKPAGLPSAEIAGSPGNSAEALINSNWGRLSAGFALEVGANPPVLCNRLDTATSGLLLCAFSQQALDNFRELEANGRVDKAYYALVGGAAPQHLCMEQELDTANRAKTKLLEALNPDVTRHTRANLLHVYSRGEVFEYFGETVSLLQLNIKRGARHQIRAHLAGAGFPIVGDGLYGDSPLTAKTRQMYLHHAGISFEGFSANIPPDWDLWPLLKKFF